MGRRVAETGIANPAFPRKMLGTNFARALLRVDPVVAPRAE
jgi:hypothetical protein